MVGEEKGREQEGGGTRLLLEIKSISKIGVIYVLLHEIMNVWVVVKMQLMLMILIILLVLCQVKYVKNLTFKVK